MVLYCSFRTSAFLDLLGFLIRQLKLNCIATLLSAGKVRGKLHKAVGRLSRSSSFLKNNRHCRNWSVSKNVCTCMYVNAECLRASACACCTHMCSVFSVICYVCIQLFMDVAMCTSLGPAFCIPPDDFFRQEICVTRALTEPEPLRRYLEVHGT